MEQLERLINAVELLIRDEKKAWITKIHAGDEEPLIALLLLHLPNLQRLNLELSLTEQNGLIADILERIGERHDQPYLLHLKSVGIDCDDVWGNSHFIPIFMSLRSLQSLYISRLTMIDETDEQNTYHLYEMKVSSIDDLKFCNCHFKLEILCLILSKIKHAVF